MRAVSPVLCGLGKPSLSCRQWATPPEVPEKPLARPLRPRGLAEQRTSAQQVFEAVPWCLKPLNPSRPSKSSRLKHRLIGSNSGSWCGLAELRQSRRLLRHGPPRTDRAGGHQTMQGTRRVSGVVSGVVSATWPLSRPLLGAAPGCDLLCVARLQSRPVRLSGDSSWGPPGLSHSFKASVLLRLHSSSLGGFCFGRLCIGAHCRSTQLWGQCAASLVPQCYGPMRPRACTSLRPGCCRSPLPYPLAARR